MGLNRFDGVSFSHLTTDILIFHLSRRRRESENRRAQRHVYWQSYLRPFSLRAPSLRTSVGRLKKDGGGISEPSRAPKRLRTPRATPPSSPSYLVAMPPGFPFAFDPNSRRPSRHAETLHCRAGVKIDAPRPCNVYAIIYLNQFGGRRPTQRQDGTLTHSGADAPSGKHAIGVGIQPPQIRW